MKHDWALTTEWDIIPLVGMIVKIGAVQCLWVSEKNLSRIRWLYFLFNTFLRVHYFLAITLRKEGYSYRAIAAKIGD